jgi:hypothetical protein
MGLCSTRALVGCELAETVKTFERHFFLGTRLDLCGLQMVLPDT